MCDIWTETDLGKKHFILSFAQCAQNGHLRFYIYISEIANANYCTESTAVQLNVTESVSTFDSRVNNVLKT